MSSQSSFKQDCLNGKVALVTGGGSGIGKVIVQTLMELGCNVGILSRDTKKLHETAQTLSAKTGRRCLPVTADVRNYDDVEAAIDRVLKEFDKIDFLVNAAAGNFLCPLDQLSFKGFKTVMEIDAYGTFACSLCVFHKAFKHRNAEAVIINISMTLHYCGAMLQTYAGAAKAAVDAMTKHMAVEWGPYKVRVNGIAPGPIANTEGLKRLAPTSPDAHERGVDLASLVPLQRLGTATDVANAVVFLCLPESSYITGAILVVDGGQWMTSCNFGVLNPSTRELWINAPADQRDHGSIRRTSRL